LTDVVRPDQGFSVAEFKRLAEQAIEGIVMRGRQPILVGGTGLYVRALIGSLVFLPLRLIGSSASV